MKCEICGREFEKKHAWQKICGRAECKKERNQRNQRAYRAKHGDYSVRKWRAKAENRAAANLQHKCKRCGIKITLRQAREMIK